MPEAAEPHFFISYTNADRVWAEWIAWQLEESGYRVKIQAWDFSPGGNFVVEMQKAIVECERTIAVFSPNYFLSEFGAAEWAAAFRLDPTGKNEKFIPVRIEACEPPGLFGSIIYIDLVKLDESPRAKDCWRVCRKAAGSHRRGLSSPERVMPDLPQAQQSPSFPEPSRRTGMSPCATGCSPDVKMLSKSFTKSSSGTDEPLSADWAA